MSQGYNPQFISNETVHLPVLADRIKAQALLGGEPIKHARFSIVFSVERHFAILTAHHIDGSRILAEGNMPERRFRFDPHIANELQVDDKRGYRHNPWDRGHLVRRRSQQWGNSNEANQATSESDYWSNIAPQHSGLHQGAWGKIEDWMLEQADAGLQQACVFTGPVNTPDDPLHINDDGELPVFIPAGFWKVMVIKHHGRLKAAGFLVWQRDYDSDRPVVFEPVLEQVRLTTIEYLTGLTFPGLRLADPLLFHSVGSRMMGMNGAIVDGQVVVRRAVEIQEAGDILL